MTVRIRKVLDELFLAPADPRVYACVRIAFSVAALTNLIMLWPDRAFLLTDAGMINQEVTRQAYLWPYLTVFSWCRDAGSVSIVMIAAGTAMVFLLLGKFQRAAALLVYVWHVSFAARAAHVVSGWDVALRCISFLVLVSPLPATWSLEKPAEGAPVARCYGLTLMRFQLLVIYWQAVLERHDNQFWLSGEFMGYYALSYFSRWPAVWLVDFDLPLRLITWLILIVEAALPLLLFSKRWHRTGILVGFLMHSSIFLVSTNLFMFLLTMMVFYLAFLRSEDIDAAALWVKKRLRPREPASSLRGGKRTPR